MSTSKRCQYRTYKLLFRLHSWHIRRRSCRSITANVHAMIRNYWEARHYNFTKCLSVDRDGLKLQQSCDKSSWKLSAWSYSYVLVPCLVTVTQWRSCNMNVFRRKSVHEEGEHVFSEELHNLNFSPVVIVGLLPRCKLMRSPCCEFAPLNDFSIPEPIVMKLGMYIMAPESITTAYFIRHSLQSVCLYAPTSSDNKVREFATVRLPWHQWTANLIWFHDVGMSAFHCCVVFIYGSLFPSGVYYCLSVLVCCHENAGVWIRALTVMSF
jgi:hypothetical protein